MEENSKGQPCHYTLTFNQNKLVENVRRIENLYRVIYRWKGAEFLVNIINSSSTISPSFMNPVEQSTSPRNIPETRYHEIIGQDAAMDMVKDYAEMTDFQSYLNTTCFSW